MFSSYGKNPQEGKAHEGLDIYKLSATRKNLEAHIICAYLWYCIIYCAFHKCAGLVDYLHFTIEAALSHFLSCTGFSFLFSYL